jgi:hypothetical protein
MTDLRDRIAFGFRIGLYCGLALSAYALLLVVLGGGGKLDRANYGVVGVVLAYLVGGPLAGVLGMLLRPLGRNWIGYVAAATLVCVPLGLLVGMTVVPISAWHEDLLLFIGIWMVAFGPMSGTIFWFVFRKE